MEHNPFTNTLIWATTCLLPSPSLPLIYWFAVKDFGIVADSDSVVSQINTKERRWPQLSFSPISPSLLCTISTSNGPWLLLKILTLLIRGWSSNDLKPGIGFILICWHVTLSNNIFLTWQQLNYLNLLCLWGDLLDWEVQCSAMNNEAWFLIHLCFLLDWIWVLPLAQAGFSPSLNLKY